MTKFLKNVFAGARERANQMGFILEEFWTNDAGMTDQRLEQILRARGIVGDQVADQSPGFGRVPPIGPEQRRGHQLGPQFVDGHAAPTNEVSARGPMSMLR